MSNGQGSARYSIVQACAYDDTEMTIHLLLVLGVLGTYTSRNGWCRPDQGTLAKRLGLSRQTVNARIARLRDLGYLEIHARFRPDGGQMANFYRILMDFELPADRRRTTAPDDDEASADPPRDARITPPVREYPTPPVGDDVTPPVGKSPTRLNVPLERPRMNDQHSPAPIGASPTHARAREEAATPRERSAKAPQGYGWIEDHSLYPVLASYLAPPATRSERGKWARVLAELGEVGATPAQIHEFMRRWHEQHPNANAHTIMAVAGNWTAMLEGSKRNGTSQRNLEAQSAAATERYERGQAQMAEIFAGLGDLLPQRADAAR